MVVIGGGIAGVSCVYHLAKAGLDVTLLEKGELTSGSTHHAAGLVTQFNPSPTMMRFRRYSVELYRELGVFDTFGSLRMASSEESLAELRTLLDELSQRDYRRVVAASQREGLRLLKRAGIEPAKIGGVAPSLLPFIIGSPDLLFRNVFLAKWKIDAKARSSMNDDLIAGRRTEVDYLNGELVALAERLGMDAPINRRIVELVRLAERGVDPWGPGTLRRKVLGR